MCKGEFMNIHIKKVMVVILVVSGAKVTAADNNVYAGVLSARSQQVVRQPIGATHMLGRRLTNHTKLAVNTVANGANHVGQAARNVGNTVEQAGGALAYISQRAKDQAANQLQTARQAMHAMGQNKKNGALVVGVTSGQMGKKITNQTRPMMHNKFSAARAQVG